MQRKLSVLNGALVVLAVLLVGSAMFSLVADAVPDGDMNAHRVSMVSLWGWRLSWIFGLLALLALNLKVELHKQFDDETLMTLIPQSWVDGTLTGLAIAYRDAQLAELDVQRKVRSGDESSELQKEAAEAKLKVGETKYRFWRTLGFFGRAGYTTRPKHQQYLTGKAA